MNLFQIAFPWLALLASAGLASMGCGGVDSATGPTGSGGGAVDECAGLPKPTVVQSTDCVTSVTTEESNVYWVVDTTGDLLEMDIRASFPDLGGGPKTVVSAYGIHQILAHQGRVYWVENEYNGGSYLGAAVKSMAPHGGDVVTLLSVSGKESPAIALNDTTLFAIDPDVGNLHAAPLAGGAAQILATGLSLSRISADNSFIYGSLSAGASTDVVRIPVAGGPAEKLALVNFQPSFIDGEYLWGFSPSSAGLWKLLRAPIDGGAAIIVAEDAFRDFTHDASYAYWISDAVHMVSIDGGPSRTLACIPKLKPGVDGWGDMVIAISATSVYFSSGCVNTGGDATLLEGTLLSVPIPKP